MNSDETAFFFFFFFFLPNFVHVPELLYGFFCTPFLFPQIPIIFASFLFVIDLVFCLSVFVFLVDNIGKQATSSHVFLVTGSWWLGDL